MNEQQFTYEIRECCKRIFTGIFMYVINDHYVENIDFRFYEGRTTWVEYFGTRLIKYDKKVVELIGRMMKAICDKHNIVFLKLT